MRPLRAGRSAAHPRAHEQVVRGYGWIAKEDLERAGVAFDHALEFAPDLPEAMKRRIDPLKDLHTLISIGSRQSHVPFQHPKTIHRGVGSSD